MAIILIVTAVLFAGCTTQFASTKTGDFGQASSGGAGTGAPAGVPVGTSATFGSTNSSSLVFGRDYTWYEYRSTVILQGQDVITDTRTEKSTADYKGTPAILLKTTTITQGRTSVMDAYYDTPMNNMLGGTITSTVNGQTMTTDIAPAQIRKQGGVIVNFPKDSNLVSKGVDPVTVPAGSYPAASKFTQPAGNGETTFWVVSEVPLWVKYIKSTPQGSNTTSELVGWG